MSKQKGSIYAAKLAELGFSPITPEESAYMEHRVDRRLQQLKFQERLASLTRKQRRLAKKIIANDKATPTFLVFGGDNPSVHAKDETGRMWIVRKVINTERLLSLGFHNITMETALAAAILPPLPPEKTQ